MAWKLKFWSERSPKTDWNLTKLLSTDFSQNREILRFVNLYSKTHKSRNAVNPNDSCWHCSAGSLSACENGGSYETCPSESDLCYIELRKRSGSITHVQTGCRSADSCSNMKQQNFHSTSFIWSQCRPEARFAASRFSVSKCSQCFAKCDQ